METAVFIKFLDFFQDYINLCQSNTWPKCDISAEEIRNAFIVSNHIEKCIEKLHQRSLLTEFMNTVFKDQNTSSLFIKRCLTDPPKYLLKKILQSKLNIHKVDTSFKIFLDLFSEETLERYLSDIMLEKASCETLLKNIQIEISKEKLDKFQSQLLISELIYCDNIEEFIVEILENCNQDVMDTLIMCLLSKEANITHITHSCVNIFIQTMLSKDVANKKFWKLIFNVKEDSFIQICLCHSDLFKAIVKALIDCARLLKENMCTEYFYIDLTYSELGLIVNKIGKNNNLKCEFLDLLNTSNTDLEFWQNIIKL